MQGCARRATLAAVNDLPVAEASTSVEAEASARRRFPQISAHAFEHPLDRTASRALQKVVGLDWVIRKFLAAIGERRLRLLHLGSAVRVDEQQFPEIGALFDEACAILDIEQRPELFITQSSEVNAWSIGVDRPFVVVTSALVELMDERELQCVLGHELGHILSGHALYTTVLMLMLRLWQLSLGIPGGAVAATGIVLSLLEWSRKAELSADRAGLLVSQDPQVSYRVDMKLAGGALCEHTRVEGFLRQSEEFRAGGDLLDGAIKVALLLNRSHPLPVLRVAELQAWVQSGKYQTILDGDYGRRGEDEADTWLQDVVATASQYQEGLSNSADPLISTLVGMGSGVAAAGGALWNFVSRRSGGAGGGTDDES